MSLAVHGRSEFDTDADVDIATMAAQRDQLRGARNVRGMMAPVMSKEVTIISDAVVVCRRMKEKYLRQKDHKTVPCL